MEDEDVAQIFVEMLAALNFNFLHCLRYVDVSSADEHAEIFACIHIYVFRLVKKLQICLFKTRLMQIARK